MSAFGFVGFILSFFKEYETCRLPDEDDKAKRIQYDAAFAPLPLCRAQVQDSVKGWFHRVQIEANTSGG